MLPIVSLAGSCVGPMMKLPSLSGGGTAPSASSVAATKPGARGSRVGGVGRGAGCGAAAAAPAACDWAAVGPTGWTSNAARTLAAEFMIRIVQHLFGLEALATPDPTARALQEGSRRPRR
jgi:hypothetical protein